MKRKVKKEDVIFGTGFFGSLVVGTVLIVIGYPLLGLIIALVGVLVSEIYMRKAKAIEINDERAQFVEGKSCIATVRITFPIFGVVFAFISVLSIDIPAQMVLGPLFTLYAATYVVSYHYYNRRYM